MQHEVNHVVGADPSISIWYRNRKFVADEIFPVVGVNDLQGKYFRYSKQAFRALPQAGAPGAFPRHFRLDVNAFGFYEAQGYDISVELPDVTRNHSDNKALVDLIHQETAQAIIALARELQAINLISTTTVPNNTTLTGTLQWSDYVNSDPITAILEEIETIQQAIGVGPEEMNLLLPRPVFRTIIRNPIVREDIKYTQNLLNAPITAQNLANALGIRKVVIAEALEQTVNEGQVDDLSYAWGNIALLYYHTGTPSQLTPNFGYTFRSTQDSYPIKTIRNEMNDATWFKSQEYRDMVLSEPYAAYLWNTPIATYP
jgi:hypothetical protein